MDKKPASPLGLSPMYDTPATTIDDKVMQLQSDLIALENIRAHQLGSAEYPSMATLAHLMQEHPSTTLLTVQPGGFNPETYFKNIGFFPLAYNNANGKHQITLAIAAENATGVRNSSEISVILNDDIKKQRLPAIMKSPQKTVLNIEYILLGKTQFEEAVRLATDLEERRRRTKAITPDMLQRERAWALFSTAVDERATDVHLEPGRIRFRVDGRLHNYQGDLKLVDPLNLVRVLATAAEFEFAQERLPQDGHLAFPPDVIKQYPNLEGINLRLSTLPVMQENGAVLKMAVRLLQKAQIRTLHELGYTPQMEKVLAAESAAPNGIIIVTGPTGSGKTSTIYSLLNMINTEDVNICSIEDPVEIGIPGINQSETHTKIGYTFDMFLKTVLRQDPDIIFGGEMRDPESARFAMDAAKTGHLVFSTLHTLDSVHAINRLYKLGIDKEDFQTCVNMVVAQRLVRKVCTECREAYNGATSIADLVQGGITVPDIPLYKATGKKGASPCIACKGKGYLGRTVVAETWKLNDAMRELIDSGETSYTKLLHTATENGLVPMAVAGVQLALQGTTTVDELLESVPPDQFVRHRPLIEKVIASYKR